MNSMMGFGMSSNMPSQFDNGYTNFGFNPGYNNNSGFGNFNAPMVDQASADWFLRSAHNQLSGMIASRLKTEQQASFIMKEIQSVLPMYITYLLKSTNGNPSGCSPEQLTNLIGQCIQNAENRLVEKYNQSVAQQSNTVVSNMMTNAFGGGWGNNGNQSPVLNNGYNSGGFDNPPQINPQEAPSSVTIGPRRRRNVQQQADNNVQSYMNNEAAQNIQYGGGRNTDPVDPTPYQSRMEQAARSGSINMPKHHVMTPEEIEACNRKTAKLRDALMNAEPIRAGANCLFEPFDLKDTGTWDSTYIERTKYNRSRVANGEIDPNTEDWVNMAAASEEYWKARGVKWVNDGDTAVDKLVEAKAEARKDLPVVEYTEVALNDHSLVFEDSKNNFKNLITEKVSHISVKKDNVPVGNAIAIDLINDALVMNEEEFLDDIMDGSLMNTVLLKDGGSVIDFNSTYDNTCLTVDYVTLKAVDIPYAEMSKFYALMAAEASRASVENFDKFYNGFTSVLYDIPRKWSEEIEHVIIDTLNNVFDRRFRSFKDAMINGPVITKWVNIYDILQARNMTFMTNSTTTYFKKLIIDTVKQIFAHELIDPTTDAGRDVIVSSNETIELVHKYYKAPITVEDINAWDPESDKDQLNKLSMNLQKFSAMVVGQSVMISDCKPQFINPGEWLFTLGDNHLDLFTYLVFRQFTYDTAMLRDAYLIVDGVLAKKPITARFKLGASADMHYGYYLDA